MQLGPGDGPHREEGNPRAGTGSLRRLERTPDYSGLRYDFLKHISEQHRSKCETILGFFLVHVDSHVLEILPNGGLTFHDQLIPGTDAAKVLVSLISSSTFELGETFLLRVIHEGGTDAVKELLHASKQGSRGQKVLEVPPKPATSDVIEDRDPPGGPQPKTQKLTSCNLDGRVAEASTSNAQIQVMPLSNPRDVRIAPPVESHMRPAGRVKVKSPFSSGHPQSSARVTTKENLGLADKGKFWYHLGDGSG